MFSTTPRKTPAAAKVLAAVRAAARTTSSRPITKNQVRATMKTRHVVGFVGASLLSFLAVDAQAGSTDPVNSSAVVVQVGGGNEGRVDGEMRLMGPGFEQTDVVTLQKDGKQFLVLVTMQSMDDKSGYYPWQCSCSSFELQAVGAPAERVHLKQLSTYKQGSGERLCNHPRIATDGNVIAWAYGSDYNNNQPNTYVGAIDHMCNVIAAPVMVNAKSTAELPQPSPITANDNNVPTDKINNNDGAADIVSHGNGLFTVGYLSTAGNATESSYALGIQITQADVTTTIKRNWIAPMTWPARIGRPTIKAIDSTRALFCSSKGNNRPQEIGTECSIVDATNGNIRLKNLIAPSYKDPDNMGGGMHYMGQPTVAKISDTSFALNVVESNGMGKNTNLKGSNIAHLYTLDLAADAMVINGHITGVAAHQTHSTICTGGFGVDGATHVGVISAPPTGIGRAEMVMVNYNGADKTFTYNDNAHHWPISWYGDSGHLANWYGRNPMRQGRDFLRCIGDVPNPGYHADGGYMKDVKTFFVAAVSGRVPGDYKNSLYLSLVPGQADTVLTPTSPQPADQPPTPTTDNSGNQTPAPSSSSGCACSTPGTSTDSGTMLGGLALVGLVIGAGRRRSTKKS
jgi:MYXO-CTERM domain-containing protein